MGNFSFVLAMPALLGLGLISNLPTFDHFIPQEPGCEPSQHTGTVVQPICGASVVWADTMTEGECPGDPCNFTDFKAALDFCSGPDIVDVKFPGQNWQTLNGSGPHTFNLPGSLDVGCGEHATKTTRFRTSTGTEGSLEMVFECSECP